MLIKCKAKMFFDDIPFSSADTETEFFNTQCQVSCVSVELIRKTSEL